MKKKVVVQEPVDPHKGGSDETKKEYAPAARPGENISNE